MSGSTAACAMPRASIHRSSALADSAARGIQACARWAWMSKNVPGGKRLSDEAPACAAARVPVDAAHPQAASPVARVSKLLRVITAERAYTLDR